MNLRVNSVGDGSDPRVDHEGGRDEIAEGVPASDLVLHLCKGHHRQLLDL